MVQGFGGWWTRLLERRQSELNVTLLLLCYVLYLLFGAGVFSAVERPYESELREKLQALRHKFLQDHACVSDELLEKILSRALQANNYGVSMLGNVSNSNWDFISSLFFTSTVLTTTGYGHTVPLSDGGKAFCIVFSLLGIPITLLFISSVVERIMVVVTRRPLAHLQVRWAVPRTRGAVGHALILTLFSAMLLFFFPALVFQAWESSWSFLDSLYFCFISLTTIGLGDYVPGETHPTTTNPHRLLYRLAITVYLLLGLVCLLVVVETWCEVPQLKSFRKKFYRGKRDGQIPEDMADMVDDTDDNELTDHMTAPPLGLPNFSYVSAQAASLRLEDPAPFTHPLETTAPVHVNHLRR
ncbi:potassium channel subfamily K member 1-like [Hypomesus transpacificus]|uniref:potassium channel subfamily K member 1-like n=1 Tax=Hypomesus transpacificus TaxID=137520 RepID=UPI001F074995|nr:potassium channel subfamily K member 1-like [Hypomesus transpacificus]